MNATERTISRLTKAQILEIQTQARHAARHHPWRASWLEVASLEHDFDARYKDGKKLSARGQEVKQIWLDAFQSAGTEIEPFTGGPGGEPCDRCGKPVEQGRWNVCLTCSAPERAEEAEGVEFVRFCEQDGVSAPGCGRQRKHPGGPQSSADCGVD